MRLFLDTGDISEVQSAASLGILGGVTTNPTLLALRGEFVFKDAIQQICAIVDGPVSAEVVSPDVEGMLAEAREIATWARNVVVKIPLTENGLRVISIVSREGIPVNTTLVFSPTQALAAALAGATYVSPFVGRLDDAGHDGMQVVRDTVQIYRAQNLKTQVLAASLRHPLHVVEAAKAGADCGTMPFKVLKQMLKHPLTDIGLERFLADWERATGSRALPIPQQAKK